MRLLPLMLATARYGLFCLICDVELCVCVCVFVCVSSQLIGILLADVPISALLGNVTEYFDDDVQVARPAVLSAGLSLAFVDPYGACFGL
jgi:hypothetical protein